MTFYKNTLRDIYSETLVELGEQYKNVVVLDADLNTSTGTAAFKAKFPNRFIQCGIAEENMFSIAAGLSYMGYVTFPSTFAAFANRKALDPIFMNICCQKLNVKIPASYPGLTATECGPSHNICEDVGIMRALPYIKVADAGDNFELASLMKECVKEEGPAYFRIPKTELPQLFDSDYKFEWGKGYELKRGKDITLLSTGMMTGLALRAEELLRKGGIDATVIHMPSIKPLDDELIIAAAKHTGCILTIENSRVFGGFGGAVAELVTREYPVVMDMMGIGDEPAKSCDLGSLLIYYKLTPFDIEQRALELIKKK